MRSDYPVTKEGNNWTVVVFKCPRNTWIQMLRELFGFLEQCEECLLPHFTVRSYDTDSLFISLRILRRGEHKNLVESKIGESNIREFEHKIDPPENHPFYPYHAWIKKNTRGEIWTRVRCEILNKLSKFVLDIIESDTTLEDKIRWNHLFSNMTSVFELLRFAHAPETQKRIVPLRYFGDEDKDVMKRVLQNYLNYLDRPITEF